MMPADRCEISHAIATLLERKNAAFPGDAALEIAHGDDLRPMLVGLDIDVHELGVHATQMGLVGLSTHTSNVLNRDVKPGESLLAVLTGLWADGVLIGLLIAEQRNREERRPDTTA